MDGSIATSASLRMRDQLRGACHAPVGGADAGLFEELLRMPVAESHFEPDADAPTTEDDALMQPPALAASRKPSSEPQGEDDGDADDEAVAEEYLTRVDTAALVQTIPTQASVVDSPSDPPSEEAVLADTDVPTQPIVSPTVSKATSTTETHVTADAVERSSEQLEPIASTVQENQVVPKSQAVAAPLETKTVTVETPTAPVVETKASADEVPSAAASSLEVEAGHFDQKLSPAAEMTSPIKVPNQTEPLSPATPVHSESRSETQVAPELSDQPQAQSAEQAPVRASEPIADETSDKSSKQDDDNERGEKWFLQDDDGPRAEEPEPASPSASQDSSVGDIAMPSFADAADGLTSSNMLGAPDADQTAALSSSATPDLSALASAIAQQNVAGNAATGRGDSRIASTSAGQVTGGRATTSSTSQAASAGSPDRDNGGVAGLSQQERVRLVQRVARSFSRLGPDGGQVTLKLHPPQLGVLNMSVRIEGQSMTAKLQTETASARDAILENLTVLRERLAEQGIEIESFQVEVASDRDLADSNQSQSQAHNPFSGDSSSGGRSGSRSIDYRRLSRSNSDTLTAAAGALRGADPSRWPSHSSLERSLDIRA